MPDTNDTQISTSGKKRKCLNDSDTTESMWAKWKKFAQDLILPTPDRTKDATSMEICGDSRSSDFYFQFFTLINLSSRQKGHSDNFKAKNSLQEEPTTGGIEDAMSIVCPDIAIVEN